MEINGTYCGSLINGVKVVLFEQIENVLSNLSVIQIPVHLGIFSLDEYARQPSVGVALAAVLLVEGDDHFKDLAQQGEGEFIVENGQPARRLILLDPQRLELTHREAVSPPISFVLPIIHPPLYPGGEVLFSADISDPCKERVVHY